MNTNKAIEIVKQAFGIWESEYCCSKEEREANTKEMNEVVAILERGEKFEKMFLRVVKWEEEDIIIVKSDLDELKDKYFPK